MAFKLAEQPAISGAATAAVVVLASNSSPFKSYARILKIWSSNAHLDCDRSPTEKLHFTPNFYLFFTICRRAVPKGSVFRAHPCCFFCFFMSYRQFSMYKYFKPVIGPISAKNKQTNVYQRQCLRICLGDTVSTVIKKQITFERVKPKSLQLFRQLLARPSLDKQNIK